MTKKKLVKYKVGKEEIALLPFGSIILNAVIIFENSEGCLIYLPRKLNYIHNNEEFISKETIGSLNFAIKCEKYYEKSNDEYLNILLKDYE